ncbi:hypothetical protein CALVIDRAFT_541255 [Calocera viscosa TUFC12733]|uniref:Uncharacterized protein n=1 Tax=Calocera viscosa (strain TUFC12733) TaxID=1330018 RepID=A0A167I201_CALVF|nr:hypothetical protein CALVIDRAFT_541255 [Calocera viscosa TUFC12733]
MWRPHAAAHPSPAPAPVPAHPRAPNPPQRQRALVLVASFSPPPTELGHTPGRLGPNLRFLLPSPSPNRRFRSLPVRSAPPGPPALDYPLVSFS